MADPVKQAVRNLSKNHSKKLNLIIFCKFILFVKHGRGGLNYENSQMKPLFSIYMKTPTAKLNTSISIEDRNVVDRFNSREKDLSRLSRFLNKLTT